MIFHSNTREVINRIHCVRDRGSSTLPGASCIPGTHLANSEPTNVPIVPHLARFIEIPSTNIRFSLPQAANDCFTAANSGTSMQGHGRYGELFITAIGLNRFAVVREFGPASSRRQRIFGVPVLLIFLAKMEWLHVQRFHLVKEPIHDTASSTHARGHADP